MKPVSSGGEAQAKLRSRLLDILDRVQQAPHTDVFSSPVGQNIHDYHSFVAAEDMMDLSKIRRAVLRGSYTSSAALKKDMEQIYLNALAYNGNNRGCHSHPPIVHWARTMVDLCVSELDAASEELCELELGIEQAASEVGKGDKPKPIDIPAAGTQISNSSPSSLTPMSSLDVLLAACELAAERESQLQDHLAQRGRSDKSGRDSSDGAEDVALRPHLAADLGASDDDDGARGADSGPWLPEDEAFPQRHLQRRTSRRMAAPTPVLAPPPLREDVDEDVADMEMDMNASGVGVGAAATAAPAKAIGRSAADSSPKYRRHKSKVFIRPNKVVYLPTTFMEENFNCSQLPIDCELVVEVDGQVLPERHHVTIKAVPRQGLSTMYCCTNVLKIQSRFLNYQIVNWVRLPGENVIQIMLVRPGGSGKSPKAVQPQQPPVPGAQLHVRTGTPSASGPNDGGRGSATHISAGATASPRGKQKRADRSDSSMGDASPAAVTVPAAPVSAAPFVLQPPLPLELGAAPAHQPSSLLSLFQQGTSEPGCLPTSVGMPGASRGCGGALSALEALLQQPHGLQLGALQHNPTASSQCAAPGQPVGPPVSSLPAPFNSAHSVLPIPSLAGMQLPAQLPSQQLSTAAVAAQAQLLLAAVMALGVLPGLPMQTSLGLPAMNQLSLNLGQPGAAAGPVAAAAAVGAGDASGDRPTKRQAL